MAARSKGSSRERVARTGVIMGGIATALAVAALVFGQSTLVLADFLKTTLEFLAILTSWLTILRMERGGGGRFEYGMEKLESVASLFMGLAMLGSMAVIVVTSILKIINPSPVAGSGIYIAIGAQVFFGVVNGRLLWQSRALQADGASALAASQARLYAVKVLNNILVGVALTLSLAFAAQRWGQLLDPAVSLVIVINMFLAATGTIRNAFTDLVDCAVEEAHQLAIVRVLTMFFDEYDGLHGVRTRRAGGRTFVEVFLEFDPGRSAAEVHDTADRIRAAIEAELPRSQAAIALAREKVC